MITAAITYTLRGEVRIAANAGESTSAFRNGGTQGNSASALRPSPQDTRILRSIYDCLPKGTRIASVSADVITIDAPKRRYPKLMTSLQRVMRQHRVSVRWFANQPAMHG